MYVCLLSLWYVALTNRGVFKVFREELWYIISKIIQVFFILMQAENMKLNDSCTVLHRTFLKVKILLLTSHRVHHMNQPVHCMYIRHLAQLVRCNEYI